MTQQEKRKATILERYGSFKVIGEKAAKTNIQRHGEDFYKRAGAIGGSRSTTGGFNSDVVGSDGLTGRQRASVAGRKGGMISRRRKITKDFNDVMESGIVG